MFEFEAFPKIPRFKSAVCVTEKVDGTNGQIALFELTTFDQVDAVNADPYCLRIFSAPENGGTPMALYAGSRSRWIRPGKDTDNYGFAAWVYTNADELQKLGPGRHFGEWYGAGIQRNYGLKEKRFALFNTVRWNPENPNRPACCGVVPVLAQSADVDIDDVMRDLKGQGSRINTDAYYPPEGIVIYHAASRQYYKRTYEKDGGKWMQEAA